MLIYYTSFHDQNLVHSGVRLCNKYATMVCIIHRTILNSGETIPIHTNIEFIENTNNVNYTKKMFLEI